MNWLGKQSPGNWEGRGRCSEHHCPFPLTLRLPGSYAWEGFPGEPSSVWMSFDAPPLLWPASVTLILLLNSGTRLHIASVPYLTLKMPDTNSLSRGAPTIYIPSSDSLSSERYVRAESSYKT